jgi:metacaspase-1
MDDSTRNELLTQLRTKFNTDASNIYKYYLDLINKVNRTYVIYRYNMVQSYILSYNADINKLKNKYNLDLQAINVAYPPTLSNKKALLIGLNYPGTGYQLSGCINDINKIEQLLRSSYRFSNVIKLHDTSQILPTKINILSQLTLLLSNAKSGDVLFFHYSGHGAQIKDVTGDEVDLLDEVIIPSDYFTSKNIITDDEIKGVIQKNLKSGVKLFILMDCCHSGTIFDLKYNFKDDWSSLVNVSSLDTLGEVILISGCKDPESTYDTNVNSIYQGSTTTSFLQCVNSNISWKQLIIDMRQKLIGMGLSVQVPQISTGRPFDVNSKIII